MSAFPLMVPPSHFIRAVEVKFPRGLGSGASCSSNSDACAAIPISGNWIRLCSRKCTPLCTRMVVENAFTSSTPVFSMSSPPLKEIALPSPRLLGQTIAPPWMVMCASMENERSCDPAVTKSSPSPWIVHVACISICPPLNSSSVPELISMITSLPQMPPDAIRMVTLLPMFIRDWPTRSNGRENCTLVVEVLSTIPLACTTRWFVARHCPPHSGFWYQPVLNSAGNSSP
mmetsp:Transcript_5008/g.8205  ORF Transcript_5008/g.8205 Transcript_5008/m.8205 type:complete len:230 (-) Transcript_5008:558-1247(-)